MAVIVLLILLVPIALLLGLSLMFGAFIWLLVAIPLAAWRQHRAAR